MAKKKQKNAFKSFLYIVMALLIALVSYITKPWEYVDTNEKPNIAENVDPDDLAVYFIDVGQADSALIMLPSGENVLIDAGCENGAERETIDAYINYIKSLGVTRIDSLFLSHPHYDHIGAADEVIRAFDIGEIILPDCDPSLWGVVLDAMLEKNLTYTPAEVGMILNVGNASFKILAPDDKFVSDDADKNNHSTVIRMVYGNTSFMFTGDAETQSETALMSVFDKSELKCDVLKVGHHGSNTSTSVKFLEAVDPAIAIISVGEGNSYGHPSDKILTRFEERSSAEVLRTDIVGTIVITSDGERITRITEDTAE